MADKSPPATTPSPLTETYAPRHDSQQHPYSAHTPSMGAPPSQYGSFMTNGAPAYGAPEYGIPGSYGTTIPPKSSKPSVCGLPRPIFWIILASGIILFLGALGAGLGVGLSNLHKDNTGSGISVDSNDTPSRTLNLSPTFTNTNDSGDDDPITTPTRTRSDTEATTIPTPTSLNLTPTGTATSPDIRCPRDDRASFFIGSSSEFDILCNTFVPGTLSQSTTQSNMSACIQACHDDSVCTGVLYWFSAPVTFNCDMYYSLEASNAEMSTADYAFAAYSWALYTTR